MKKESFILYTEYEQYINELDDTEGMKVIRAIFAYKARGEIHELSGMAKMVFMVIKNSLDRDSKKYEEVVQARVAAGSRGGKQKVANVANASFAKQSIANVAVYDNEHVSGNDNEPVSEHEDKEPPRFQVSKTGITSNDGTARIEKARSLWNSSGAKPAERYMVIQFKPEDLTACLATIQAFSDEEIADSIKNYCELLKSLDHNVADFQYGSFPAFMRKGVSRFITAADPWTTCRKKAAPVTQKFPDTRKEVKVEEQTCPVCGNKYKSTGSCPRCKFDSFHDSVEEYRLIWRQRQGVAQ